MSDLINALNENKGGVMLFSAIVFYYIKIKNK